MTGKIAICCKFQCGYRVLRFIQGTTRNGLSYLRDQAKANTFQGAAYVYISFLGGALSAW